MTLAESAIDRQTLYPIRAVRLILHMLFAGFVKDVTGRKYAADPVDVDCNDVSNCESVSRHGEQWLSNKSEVPVTRCDDTGLPDDLEAFLTKHVDKAHAGPRI